MHYRVMVTLVIQAPDQSSAGRHAYLVTDGLVESNVAAKQAHVTSAIVTSAPKVLKQEAR